MGVRNKIFGRLSYILLLEYVYDHCEDILKRLDNPIIWENNDYLMLANNALEQLNIISERYDKGGSSISNNGNFSSIRQDETEYVGKYRSLFNIINYNSTAIGRRALKNRLINPIQNVETLNSRYNQIEEMMDFQSGIANCEFYQQFERKLVKIYDIEKFHRKIAMGRFYVTDINSLDISYQGVIELLSLFEQIRSNNSSDSNNSIDCPKPHLMSLVPTHNEIDIFNEFIEDYRKRFDFSKCTQPINKLERCFFNKGVYPELDKIQNEIDIDTNFLDILIGKLSKWIDPKCKKPIVNKKYNETMKHHICCTIKRSKILKERFQNMGYRHFKIGKYTIDPKQIVYNVISKNQVHIKIDCIEKSSISLVVSVNYIKKKQEEIFNQLMNDYYQKYHLIWKRIVKFIGEVDMIKSCAKTAIINGYSKPIINENNPRSYFEATGIRHPIIEKIQTKIPYVPNNLCLGKRANDRANDRANNNVNNCGVGLDGVLLFGVNAVGKCFGKGTKLRLYNGKIKKVEDINDGDLLMGDDSTPRTVKMITWGKGQLYKISTWEDYDFKYYPNLIKNFVINGEHILVLRCIGYRKIIKHTKKKWWRVEWIQGLKIHSRTFRWNHIFKDIIDYEKTEGLFQKKEYVEILENQAEKYIYNFFNKLPNLAGNIIEIKLKDFLKQSKKWQKCWQMYRVPINFKEKKTQYKPYRAGQIACLMLQTNNRNYIIPDDYIYNTYSNRLKFLAGILDGRGKLTENNSEIAIVLDLTMGYPNFYYDFRYSSHYRMIKTIKFMFESCGFHTSEILPYFLEIKGKNMKHIFRYSEKYLYKRDILDCGICPELDFRGLNFSIAKSEENGEYYGFETDGNHKFVLADFTVTHNSSLMKSVGINIIMAQAGMYVPCTQFVYKPYKYLFTRIWNNDNIFKGQSSFAVEMSELKCIMKNADQSSIVLGDELCSGTETVSASALVAAGIVTLAQRNVNFIFATHLHFLSTNSRLKALNNVKNYHMSVVFDDANNRLIYNRILQEGSGPSTYGLEVCKSMYMDSDFLKMADSFRREMSGMSKYLYEGRESIYNANKIVDLCEVCQKEASDTHHIRFQSEADANGMIGQIHKNTESNLTALCTKCHNAVHNGNLDIRGYKATSDGPILDYQWIQGKKEKMKKSRKKLSDRDIKTIKQYLDNYNNLTKRVLKERLKEKENISVSLGLIRKISRNEY